MSFLAEEVEAQVDDIAKGADPTTHIRTRGSDGRTTGNGETAGVVSGGIGRIRKGFLPQFDVGFLGVELDASEKVFS